MINPNYVYILTFSIAFLTYLLGWSKLYPPFSFPLIIFLLVSFFFHFIFGFLIQKKRVITFQKINNNKNIFLLFNFTIFLWIIEFIYARGIPLVQILLGNEYNYRTFGVPSLHVFVVTFTSFLATYLFHIFLSNKSRKTFILFLLITSTSLLIMNRGMLLLILSNCLFIFLIKSKRIRFKTFSGIVTTILLVLFFFGLLGNLRLSHSVNKPYNETIILDIAKAEKGFVNSPIPKEYFWPYLYISSPLANLQETLNKTGKIEYSLNRFFLLIINEFHFDFISKRIDTLLNHKKIGYKQIAPFLTVGTVYARSYSYFSWIGLCLMGSFILLFTIFYLGILKKQNVFFITGVATLNTIYLFLIFDNMFTFSGLSLQLIYPLILGPFIKKQNV